MEHINEFLADRSELAKFFGVAPNVGLIGVSARENAAKFGADGGKRPCKEKRGVYRKR